MHKVSDKDKKIWNFYISNLNAMKRVEKKKEPDFVNISETYKALKPNTNFLLDSKTKRQIKNKKAVFDAIVDLHGKTEVQAHKIIKNFIINNYLNNIRNIIIVTGKGANNQGKLKLKTPLWLKSEELSKYIVGFTNMPNNRGGDGALFVKLKNANKYS
tara:strand:+ start:95 stop:568 length:474 start_codon:yes stop_codon:yes gene_type:complete